MLQTSSDRDSRALSNALAEVARRQRARIDIADWGEQRFYIKDTRRPIRLELFEKAVLRGMFQRGPTGLLLYHDGVWGAPKKQGKTTEGALIVRWFAETQTRMGEITLIGNDLKQAKEREFIKVVESIRLTPGCQRLAGEYYLPDEWRCQMTKMECLTSGTKVQAVAIDAAGEAGGEPDLTCWTELGSLKKEAAEEFWTEMTPILTKADSFRFVEGYAGHTGESKIYWEHYQLGKDGRQLTNGELASIAARDKEGETYDDFLFAFAETEGNPDTPIPIWVHESAGMFMYWDEDEPEGVARRMPWQKGPEADAYYRGQSLTMPSNQYMRVHRNKWMEPEGEFIPMESWDACQEGPCAARCGECRFCLGPQLPPFLPEGKEPCVIAVDAATSNDCFAVTAATRHPDANRQKDPAIRACKKWDPAKEGGTVDYTKPEGFIRTLSVGGCVQGHPLAPNRQDFDLRYGPGPDGKGAKPFLDRWPDGCGSCRDRQMVAPYNVQLIAYDPMQLEDMMQRIRRELGVRCKKFDQGSERLIADSQFYTVVMQRRLAHDGNLELREHIENCAAKTPPDDDSKMRIVKKKGQQKKKIDLAVASSMAVREIMRLVLTAEG